jgi:8-oxo-dGTP pyrophosphatase MutT (NUDIX family)
MNDLAERSVRVEHMQSPAYLRPKDAATLILIDRDGPIPKVLLGRRHASHVFMAGKFVFPGGRLDPSDRRVVPARPLHAHVQDMLAHRVTRPSVAHARALAVAAIRETFEETGLMIGAACAPGATMAAEPWNAFASVGIAPDLSVLHFIARAITPPGRPRRFDARFFAADASAIAHRLEGVVGPAAELVELTWVPIAKARGLDLPSITRLILEDLEARIATGFGHELPVPLYRTIRGRNVRELL